MEITIPAVIAIILIFLAYVAIKPYKSADDIQEAIDFFKVTLDWAEAQKSLQKYLEDRKGYDLLEYQETFVALRDHEQKTFMRFMETNPPLSDEQQQIAKVKLVAMLDNLEDADDIQKALNLLTQ